MRPAAGGTHLEDGEALCGQVDAAITVTELPAAVVGDNLTYTIAVRNLGTDATGVVMTDAIPAGTTYVPSSLSCQGGTGSCTGSGPGAHHGRADTGAQPGAALGGNV